MLIAAISRNEEDARPRFRGSVRDRAIVWPDDRQTMISPQRTEKKRIRKMEIEAFVLVLESRGDKDKFHAFPPKISHSLSKYDPRVHALAPTPASCVPS